MSLPKLCTENKLDKFLAIKMYILVSPQNVEVRPNGNVYEGKLNTLLCISHASKPAPFMLWHIQCE